jgi:hypothetical protein
MDSARLGMDVRLARQEIRGGQRDEAANDREHPNTGGQVCKDKCVIDGRTG